MKIVTDLKEKTSWKLGETVNVHGMIHTIRNMGEVAFVILRKREGLLQCVFEEGKSNFEIKNLKEQSAVEIRGEVAAEERAPGGMEIRIRSLTVLSEPTEPLPVPVSKWNLNVNPETMLDLRPITLRNIKERARFKIQEGIVRGFRDYLQTQEFTEVRTPKIVSRGAEGGANVFKLDYFGKKAELAQSPQFYKQMMVGVFDRVFEVGPVFRAEKHNTQRHLNEYTSLDFEMGFIQGFEDIMAMEEAMLQNVMQLLEEEYKKELEILQITLPDATNIPCISFEEAKRKVAEKYNRPIRNPYDLEPAEEVLISKYCKEEYHSDFVFVTHYPSKKRPFYAMDDPENPLFTLSFDLLYNGIEITTGGQRIHDYNMLREKIASRGMSEEGIEHYLMIFKHGMPPHGGLGIGLERLAMKLTGKDNIRETTLFPRDLSRLEP